MPKAKIKVVKSNSAAHQLELFKLLPDDKKYSNTIELYDGIPKYALGKNKYSDAIIPIERSFKHKGNAYNVVIKPAIIKDNNGKYVHALPGQREEYVEDALRKIACDGNIIHYGHQVGVVFTLYQLQNELKRTNHTYSNQQLKESIDILSSASMKLTMVIENGKAEEIFSETLFSSIAGKTEENWVNGDGKKTTYVVFFNSLVKKSIFELTFRRYNYEICMLYSNVISRYLHKRMSHNYLQASVMNKYEIYMSTIISGSGIKKYQKPALNNNYIIKALDEMKEHKVILDYDVQRITGDYKYTLVPAPAFVEEVRKTNQRVKIIKELPK